MRRFNPSGNSRPAQVLRVLRAHETGLTTAQIGERLGITTHHASEMSIRLIRYGQVARVGNHAAYTYYACEHAEKAMAAAAAASRQVVKPQPAAVMKGGLSYVSGDGVKVTICPCGMDQRFTFAPPARWQGAITRDWIERRLREAQG